MKKSLPLLSRFLALWLILSLALPAPSFALREIQTKNSGVEERELTAALLDRPIAAGAEEKQMLAEELRAAIATLNKILDHTKSARSDAWKRSLREALGNLKSGLVYLGKDSSSGNLQRDGEMLGRIEVDLFGAWVTINQYRERYREVLDDLDLNRMLIYAGAKTWNDALRKLHPEPENPSAGAEETWQWPWKVELEPALSLLGPSLRQLIQQFIVPVLFRVGISEEEHSQRQSDLLEQLKPLASLVKWESLITVLESAADGKAAALELLRWINSYILLPQGIALHVDPDLSVIRLIPVEGYELFLLPKFGVPIPLIYTTRVDGSQADMNGTVFVLIKPSKIEMEITRDEELSHATDALRFELSTLVYQSPAHDKVYASFNLSSTGRLRDFLQKLTEDSPELALATILEARALLRRFAGGVRARELYQELSVYIKVFKELGPSGVLYLLPTNERFHLEHSLSMAWVISELAVSGLADPVSDSELQRFAKELWKGEFRDSIETQAQRVFPNSQQEADAQLAKLVRQVRRSRTAAGAEEELPFDQAVLKAQKRLGSNDSTLIGVELYLSPSQGISIDPVTALNAPVVKKRATELAGTSDALVHLLNEGKFVVSTGSPLSPGVAPREPGLSKWQAVRVVVIKPAGMVEINRAARTALQYFLLFQAEYRIAKKMLELGGGAQGKQKRLFSEKDALFKVKQRFLEDYKRSHKVFEEHRLELYAELDSMHSEMTPLIHGLGSVRVSSEARLENIQKVLDLAAKAIGLLEPQIHAAGVEETTLTLHNKAGQKIVVTQISPSSAGSYPVAIVLHGLTGSRKEPHIQGLARHLAGHGDVVLIPDLRNNGPKQGNESDGALTDYSLEGQIDDVAQVLQHLNSEVPSADLSHVILAGHSYGGMLARHIAAKIARGDDPRFQGIGLQAVIDLSGVVSPKGSMLMNLKRVVNQPGAEWKSALQAMNHWAETGSFKPYDGQRYWLQGWEDYDAAAELAAIPAKVPYLYVIGDQDTGILNSDVPEAYGQGEYRGLVVSTPVQRFLEAIETRGIPVKIIPGMAHAYAGPAADVPPQAMSDTLLHVDQQLFKPAAVAEELPKWFREQKLYKDLAAVGVHRRRRGTVPPPLIEATLDRRIEGLETSYGRPMDQLIPLGLMDLISLGHKGVTKALDGRDEDVEVVRVALAGVIREFMDAPIEQLSLPAPVLQRLKDHGISDVKSFQGMRSADLNRMMKEDPPLSTGRVALVRSRVSGFLELYSRRWATTAGAEEPAGKVLEELSYRFEIEPATVQNQQGAFLVVNGRRKYFRSFRDEFFSVHPRSEGGVYDLELLMNPYLKDFLFGFSTVAGEAMRVHPPEAVRQALKSGHPVIVLPQLSVTVEYTSKEVWVTVNGEKAYRINRADAADVRRMSDGQFTGEGGAGLAMVLALAAIVLDDALRPKTEEKDRYTMFALLPGELRSSSTAGAEERAIPKDQWRAIQSAIRDGYTIKINGVPVPIGLTPDKKRDYISKRLSNRRIKNMQFGEDGAPTLDITTAAGAEEFSSWLDKTRKEYRHFHGKALRKMARLEALESEPGYDFEKVERTLDRISVPFVMLRKIFGEVLPKANSFIEQAEYSAARDMVEEALSDLRVHTGALADLLDDTEYGKGLRSWYRLVLHSKETLQTYQAWLDGLAAELRQWSEKLGSMSAGAEEKRVIAAPPRVERFEGFTRRDGTLPLDGPLDRLVASRHVRPGERRAVVYPSADSVQVTRLFIHEALPQIHLPGVQTIEIPADPRKAAALLQAKGVRDNADLIILPLAVGEGSETQYRPAGSRTAILAVATDVLEEAAARGNLDELAQVAANLRDHDRVLRVGLEQWAEHVSNQQDAFSISY